jgi:hypothetical protein
MASLARDVFVSTLLEAGNKGTAPFAPFGHEMTVLNRYDEPALPTR